VQLNGGGIEQGDTECWGKYFDNILLTDITWIQLNCVKKRWKNDYCGTPSVRQATPKSKRSEIRYPQGGDPEGLSTVEVSTSGGAKRNSSNRVRGVGAQMNRGQSPGEIRGWTRDRRGTTGWGY